MTSRLSRALAALAIIVSLLGPSSPAQALRLCVALRSPSTGIHMTSLSSVNGGYWDTVFNATGLFVQYVPAYGLWIEVWIGNQLYLFPEFDADHFADC